MPTYEYACKQCGEHLEVFQKFTDEPLTTCPACSGPLRKVFGNIGISFKGSGFYKTDSRTDGGTKKEKEPATADTSSSSSGGSGDGGDGGGGGGKAKPDSTSKPDAKKSDKGSTAAAS